ncbi:hypothetical protein K456DRAFT_526553 [Colletotrichum gloeosporioides 23]|nr:hypothetical protein K456DRAFT_526553 [Colletotrichum gloeosporioides 23]
MTLSSLSSSVALLAPGCAPHSSHQTEQRTTLKVKTTSTTALLFKRALTPASLSPVFASSHLSSCHSAALHRFASLCCTAYCANTRRPSRTTTKDTATAITPKTIWTIRAATSSGQRLTCLIHSLHLNLARKPDLEAHSSTLTHCFVLSHRGRKEKTRSSRAIRAREVIGATARLRRIQPRLHPRARHAPAFTNPVHLLRPLLLTGL